MLNTAIIYESKHHGNTKKLVDAIARTHEVTLIDALTDGARDLSGYDLIGFASGIYCAKFGKNVLKYAENHLPADKAQPLQIPQRGGEHGAGDPGKRPLQLPKPAEGLFAQLIDDMRAPLPV